MLRFDPRHAQARDDRAGNLQAAAGVLGLPTATLSAPVGDLPPAAGALIAGALAMQLLALEVVLARGTNPDLIRREQPRYRAAASTAPRYRAAG